MNKKKLIACPMCPRKFDENKLEFVHLNITEIEYHYFVKHTPIVMSWKEFVDYGGYMEHYYAKMIGVEPW